MNVINICLQFHKNIDVNLIKGKRNGTFFYQVAVQQIQQITVQKTYLVKSQLNYYFQFQLGCVYNNQPEQKMFQFNFPEKTLKLEGLNIPKNAISVRQSIDCISIVQKCSEQCWIKNCNLQRENHNLNKQNQELRGQNKQVKDENLKLTQYLDTIRAQRKSIELQLHKKNQTIQTISKQLSILNSKYQNTREKEKLNYHLKSMVLNQKIKILKDSCVKRQKSNNSEKQRNTIKSKDEKGLKELQLQNRRLIGKLQSYQFLVKKQQQSLCKYISQFNYQKEQFIKNKTRQIEAKYQHLSAKKNLSQNKLILAEKKQNPHQKQLTHLMIPHLIVQHTNTTQSGNVHKPKLSQRNHQTKNQQTKNNQIDLFKQSTHQCNIINSSLNRPQIKQNKTLLIRPKTYHQINNKKQQTSIYFKFNNPQTKRNYQINNEKQRNYPSFNNSFTPRQPTFSYQTITPRQNSTNIIHYNVIN